MFLTRENEKETIDYQFVRVYKCDNGILTLVLISCAFRYVHNLEKVISFELSKCQICSMLIDIPSVKQRNFFSQFIYI